MDNIERLEKVIQESLVLKDGVPLPSIIEISPIDSCNRACTFCPRSNSEIAPNNPNEMSFELIKKLYGQLGALNYKGLVVFSGFSEPFMYKDLQLAVGLLSEVCKVDVVTNGDYLSKAKVEVLMKLGINMLLISVYEKKRLSIIETMTKDYMDRVMIRPRFDGFKLTNRGGTLNTAQISNPCYYPAYSMMIDWNGDVLLCPQDWNRKVKFGNINTESLFDIWKSDHMTRFRKKLFEARKDSPCNKCDANGIVHGEEHRKLWVES
jgi:radical SAM protein with 4Fe4S-binding SPASM domain